MNRALNHILLPPRLLGLSCLVTLLLTGIQAVTLLGVTDSIASLVAPTGATEPNGMVAIGRALLVTIPLSGALCGWIVIAQSPVFGSDNLRFLGQLPVSPGRLHHARLRADLTFVFAPLLLSIAVLLSAAALRGVAARALPVAAELLAGLLLGGGIFGLVPRPSATSSLRKVGMLILSVMPVGILLVVDATLLTTLAAATALVLLYFRWQREPQPSFVAPTRLHDSGAVTEAAKVDTGRKLLRGWILRHTLFQWQILVMAAFVILFPARNLGVVGHSGSSSSFQPVVLYFLAAMALPAAMVNRKLQMLPLSPRRVFPYIVLPLFGCLALGVTVVESIKVSGLAAPKHAEAERQLPIRFEFDGSLVGDGSVRRLVVPPQLLEFSASGTEVELPGPRGSVIIAPVVPLLWRGGPGLFNPYEVPESRLEEAPDTTVLCYQLERALTAFFGSSLDAAEIEARFVKHSLEGEPRFNGRAFEEWERSWAVEHTGSYQEQEDYWREQLVYLMPARIIGWIAGWGVALWLVFLLLGRYVSRTRYYLRQAVLWTAIGALFAGTIGGPVFLDGRVFSAGFVERGNMFATQAVRALLPEDMILGWLGVGVFFALVYYLVYRTYLHAEWCSMPTQTGLAKRNYEKWERI
jgi:hypothetical protein